VVAARELNGRLNAETALIVMLETAEDRQSAAIAALPGSMCC